uniref:Splicing factor 45 n=1 Tax=Lynceus sp. MCZ IZ 141354 TaxID=1930659 RepID=A0A9N6WTB8_9CRUS|nr:EOG090X0BIL [Lynceus sp. MCZ IZ 141354]
MVIKREILETHSMTTVPVLPALIPKHERSLAVELDWDVSVEYDPLWPNDYEKIIRERREKRGLELEKEEVERKRRIREERDLKPKERYIAIHKEEEEGPRRASIGAAIAPPPSLQESSPASSAGTGSVAAKIMAKYGFKEGLGLGRQMQGIATALQVEKTSKRGGRILSEKDVPPPFLVPPSPVAAPKPETSITEMMKNPSKVVLLKNMVGKGEVDSDLEPEVKEECQTKYGEVNKVMIVELPDAADEESVQIFVEFKRIEAAIKAVVDLNGRFFGGRQVKAGFYDVEHFQTMSAQT